MATQKPLPASTVVLCKVTTKWPYKILLVKRNEFASFLPGAYVFPGGRVESTDVTLGSSLAEDKVNLKRIQSYFGLNLESVSAYIAAAIRETFEEVGISILHLHNFWPISWWITPKGETRRYDTWFFMTLVDDSMMSDVDHSISNETSNPLWLSPHEALLLYQEGTIFLAPPTRSILERMSTSKSLEEFMSYVDTPLRPINPFFIEEDNKKLLILPGDPLHHERQKSSMPLYTRYNFP